MYKPNFLILGAARSATTFFYVLLKCHPDVYFSEPKEPLFFESDEYHEGIDFYWEKYFPGWSGQRAVGEARVTKLYLPFIANRIYALLPEVKCIAVIRNPIDRAYSHWWKNLYQGSITCSFEEALEKNLMSIDAGVEFGGGEEGAKRWKNYGTKTSSMGSLQIITYLQQGYYAKHIRHYMNYFQDNQMKIVLFEDLINDPKSVAIDTWEWLGIGTRNGSIALPKARNVAFPNSLKRISEIFGRRNIEQLINLLPPSLQARVRENAKPPIDFATRQWLFDHYNDHNRELEWLLGRNLSHWV